MPEAESAHDTDGNPVELLRERRSQATLRDGNALATSMLESTKNVDSNRFVIVARIDAELCSPSIDFGFINRQKELCLP